MDQLNEKIWKHKRLIPEIKEKLLTIVKKVVNDLEIEVNVKNVIFTGSLASYVWRASSDIDLHIIVEPKDESPDISDEYFALYCKLFNSYHDIFIKGYKVEVNLKREEKILDDKGVYDILTNTWIQKPSPPSENLKNSEIADITLKYQNMIDDLIVNDSPLEKVDEIRREIKTMRTSGLEEDGEFSTGNLVFKELRHSGYLEKLFDYKLKKEDQYLSFESFGNFFSKN